MSAFRNYDTTCPLSQCKHFGGDDGSGESHYTTDIYVDLVNIP